MGTLNQSFQKSYINLKSCEEVFKETITNNESDEMRKILLEKILQAVKICKMLGSMQTYKITNEGNGDQN